MHKPLEKMQVVVLRTIKYGDSSAVVRCYSDLYGLVSFMANGVSTKKGVLKPAMVFPLTTLEVVAYKSPKGALERLKEVRLHMASPGVMGNPLEGSMAAFAAEFFGAVVKEENANAQLFSFLQKGIHTLNGSPSNREVAHFPLFFMLGVMDALGFLPTPEPGKFFNMLDGHFGSSLPEHPYVLSGLACANFSLMLQGYHQKIPFDFSKDQRLQLLENLLLFCKIHHEPLLNIKSVAVIRELLA